MLINTLGAETNWSNMAVQGTLQGKVEWFSFFKFILVDVNMK